MKKANKKIIGTLLGISAILSVNSLKAQNDSVRVVTDTVKTEKVVHDTVKVTQLAPQPVSPPPAQDTKPPLRRGELGIRFMPTFTSLSFNTYNGGTVQGEASLSYGYGAMLGLNFSKNVGIQAEVNYTDIEQKYKDANLDRDIHINYLNIPVMLSLNTDKTKCVNLNFVAGPQFGINVGSNMTTNSSNSADTLHAVLAVKQGDIGIAYGVGLEFALNKMHTIRFDIGFRGVYGLVYIDEAQTSADTYNILVHATRKSYAGYAGLTFLF
ncbi:MAG: porin family protein [Bacteroidia bacterium]